MYDVLSVMLSVTRAVGMGTNRAYFNAVVIERWRRCSGQLG